MNVLLFDAKDETAPGRVRVDGRRLRHAREILRAQPGDELVVGRLGGRLGRGRVAAIDAQALELEVTLDREPPPPHPAALALALPRPPSVRKVLQQGAALGVKRFLFFASARVEKSYWQSSALRPEALHEQLTLGLEQAVDTLVPTVEHERSFRRFAAETLPAFAAGVPVLAAHPGHAPAAPVPAGRCVLVVGPEGGFLDGELEALVLAGAQRVGLGPRVLRVETAVVALLSKLAD
ncbi:MAG TPA: 16S rRNA (uracil(1498)-N(3))-methyltransferase [Myxococcota bacterium]|nr:16S rRNA (uracil(1498)-N(3))-methyltransferase [Myxococcota bacterium]